LITNLHIKNFFSFKDCSINLHPNINILVGINGSGKSNLLKAIQLLCHSFFDNNFKSYINSNLGIDKILHLGNGKDNKTYVETNFKFDKFLNEKTFNFMYSQQLEINNFNFIINETIELTNGSYDFSYTLSRMNDFIMESIDNGGSDIKVPTDFSIQNSVFNFNNIKGGVYFDTIKKRLNPMCFYFYFDTTSKSKIRNIVLPTGDRNLYNDGSNLATILNTLKINDKISFNKIIEELKRINPNFNGIDFNQLANNIELMFDEKGFNKSVHVSQVSDGTLKFLCLLAIFYNPNRGSIVCIDEPETGLHPDMLTVIADGIKYASETSQMIISTHSPFLLDHFALENVRVFEKDEENATIVKQFNNEEFAKWRNSYTVGELWTNGHLGGVRW
jgi:predicted ATPase